MAITSKPWIRTFAATALVAASTLAHADITIGVIVSLSGPAASLGIPSKNAIEVLPPTIGGQKVKIVMLDDASDTATAVRHAQKLVNEDKIDVLIGPTTSPNAIAVLDTIGRAQTVMMPVAGSSAIIEPPEGNRRFAFKHAPSEAIQAKPIFDHLQQQGGKTIAYIAVANAFGETWMKGTEAVAVARGLKTIAVEKYAAADTSVTAQVLKIIAANPDAVLIASFGTPGVLPIIELRRRGYKGLIYFNQGMANQDVLRLGGKDLEGAFLPAAPVLVAEQLPDGDPVKKVALDFVKAFEAKHGAGNRALFGATVWDAYLMLEATVPTALKAGAPGTAAFRVGLRDAMERLQNIALAEGVYSFSEKNHNGADDRAQVLVKVENGRWVLMK